MNLPVPPNPKIYHIVHVDRLQSIIAENGLLCDADMAHRPSSGTVIGMHGIKQRRLVRSLNNHPGLRVGGCVPFYFCPRSVMLYLIHMGNHPELEYRGDRSPSFIWKPTFVRPLRGQRTTGCVGHSHCPMQGLVTVRTDRIWRNWAKSTGVRWQRETGETVWKQSRRNSSSRSDSPGS